MPYPIQISSGKLHTPKLAALTSKIPEVCCTRIAIPDDVSVMSLPSSKSVHTIHNQPNHLCWWQQQKSCSTTSAKHEWSNYTKLDASGRASCPIKDSVCWCCSCTGHWLAPCYSGIPVKKVDNVNKKQGGSWCLCNHGCGSQMLTNIVGVKEDYDAYCDEVTVKGVVSYSLLTEDALLATVATIAHSLLCTTKIIKQNPDCITIT